MNINIVGDKCTGCYACFNACPRKAIEMIRDHEGFLYPVVNETVCTHCSACNKVCPISSPEHMKRLKSAYYGWHKDEEVRHKSSSGGAFTAIAEYVLAQNGVVFGAAYDSKHKEIFHTSTQSVTLDELRRSKYSESRIGDSFLKVKKLLEDNKPVLFCATPCQIAGLNKFLKKDYKHLILCDFVCGGGASQRCFKEHLEFLENKYQSEINSVNFRPKLYGWRWQIFRTTFNIGKQYNKSGFLDSYIRGFVSKLIIRKCCFKCQVRDNHYSDIVLADFWNYKDVENIVNDDKGMSLIVTNSNKGEQVIKATESRFLYHPLDFKYVEKSYQRSVYYRMKLEKRNSFFNLMDEIGFEKAAKKTYMKKTGLFRIKTFIRLLLKKIVIRYNIKT